MSDTMDAVRAWPAWSSLDRQLADLLVRDASEASPELWLSIALCSSLTRRGDVCVDLRRCAGRSLSEVIATGSDVELELETDLRCPGFDEWRSVLEGTDVVGRDGEPSPLVLTDNRLYLARYRRHEVVLAERIRERLSPVRISVELDRVRELVARWFVGAPAPAKQAAVIAATRRWCMITGGPGTGKTSTVVRLLGLLSELEVEKRPRVLLLAPTGKAAARLSESIRQARDRLGELSTRIAELPTRASTIHAALAACRRTVSGGRVPLAGDVVILDEASMVDLALMRKLMDAAEYIERLVVLGDPHQLASVEAGAVLAELSRTARGGSAAPDRAVDDSTDCVHRAAEAANGVSMAGHGVELIESHRFRSEGGIGLLAARINAGDAEGTLAVLSGNDSELGFLELPGYDLERVERRMAEASLPLALAKDPEEALAVLDRFRVLCAHRRGRFGVETWNERVALHVKQLLGGQAQPKTQPILITQNAREIGLHNGDLGVIWREEGRTRAYFASTQGVSEYGLSRLPRYEPAYVMSIHKSQGSEVDEVVVLLPEAGSALLTRELLYTAVTRAKKRCTVVGTRAAVAAAVSRRVERHSGLAATLAELLPPLPNPPEVARQPASSGPSEHHPLEAGRPTTTSTPREQLTLDFGTPQKGRSR